ncbi:MAG: NADH-quinone oxidoreductase subunit C [Alphaproteobacteria bacterium]
MLSVEQLQSEIQRALGPNILQMSVELGELSVLVARTRIVDVLRTLRDDPAIAMSQLMDICGADYPERPERFEIVYNLLSLRHNARVRIKLHTYEATPVPSVVSLYNSAGWFERETWDMFGVPFSGNPDMRRILSDYGFEGHPLRKDFPLTGYVEVRYDEDLKRIIYEPVKLPQDFRSFDFLSPWEGMTDVNMRLPGDEKATKPDAANSGVKS